MVQYNLIIILIKSINRDKILERETNDEVKTKRKGQEKNDNAWENGKGGKKIKVRRS